MTFEIPESYLAMPRWWHDAGNWLEALPSLVDEVSRTWGVALDGAAMHGSQALVVPVVRNGEALALRLAPPGDRLRDEIAALRFWDGRGTVRLLEADAERGAMLLERLGESLERQPLAVAMPVLGGLIRRLAVPAPDDVPHTSDMVRARSKELPEAWARLGKPFSEEILEAALVAGERVAVAGREGDLAVNGDLHSAQVLARPGESGSWVVVDPRLHRGDPAYPLATVLWTRVDEMANATEIRRWAGVVAAAAGIPWRHAVDWIVWRTVDYWLWGLEYGLTEDPIRCRRLVEAVLGKRLSS